jgi:hypothetical protein
VLRVVNWGTRGARVTANLNGASAAAGPGTQTQLRVVNVTLLAGVSGAPDETNPPWDSNRVAAKWCVGQGTENQKPKTPHTNL